MYCDLKIVIQYSFTLQGFIYVADGIFTVKLRDSKSILNDVMVIEDHYGDCFVFSII